MILCPFFFSAPASVPRTESACQPVTAVISAIVAPSGRVSLSTRRSGMGGACAALVVVWVGAGLVVTVRTARGSDVTAACGQLVGRVVDRTRRSERYLRANQPEVVRVG